MSRIRRVQSFVLALALLAGLLAVPAGAATILSTSSVVVADGVSANELLAGEQKQLVFTVANNGSTGTFPIDESDPSINWVRIRPENDDPAAYSIDQVAEEDGWSASIVRGGRDVVFTGATIAAAADQPFSIWVTPSAVDGDLPTRWLVDVSSDAGDTNSDSAPSTPGALDLQIRVLNVDSVTPTAPTGVLDGTATAGQDNIVVTSVVSNHAGSAKTVTPALDSSQSDTIGAPTPADASIAPTDTQAFDFPVTLGNAVNNRTFTGDATAAGADAIADASDNLATQAPAQFAYAGGTLTPLASASGVIQNFRLSLNKTNIPSVDLNTDSLLTFTNGADSFSTNLAGITSFGTGSQTVLLEFAPVTIPGALDGFEDGGYTPSLDLYGVDGNDATVVREDISVNETFKIDNLVPVVDVTLGGPAAQLTPEGVSVVRNGNPLTFGGTVKESGDEGAALDPEAVLTECLLVVKNAGGVPTGTTFDVTGDCSNDGGNIQGSHSVTDFGIDEGSVELWVKAADAAGNETTEYAVSDSVLIDNLDPDISGATTGCGIGASETCNDNTTIRVALDEPVKGMFSSADFMVDENIVVSATPEGCHTTWVCGVTLTLLQEFGDDATPVVNYTFQALPTRTRPTDGPANELGDAIVGTVDGILPPLPSLDGVSQNAIDGQESYGQQGSESAYYTNDNTPTFTFGGLSNGYTGIIALDTSGNGSYDPALDQAVAECAATSSTAACEATFSLAASATAYDIMVTSVDPAGNIGFENGNNARFEKLYVDQTAPTAASATKTVNSVTVTFDEVLARGSNSAGNWNGYWYDGGTRKVMGVNEVTGSDNIRNLTINSANFAFLAEVAYEFIGAAPNRYRDFAGNYLGDDVVAAP